MHYESGPGEYKTRQPFGQSWHMTSYSMVLLTEQTERAADYMNDCGENSLRQIVVKSSKNTLA